MAASLAVVGCQTYDFEPVTPQTWVQSITYKTVDAKHFKPNLWLLVDSSGSMEQNRDACTNGVCVTRMAALKTAMATFLNAPEPVARMALTFFPATSADQCAPANSVAVGLPGPTPDDVGTSATLVAHAARINSEIGKRPGIGGTPTGASVAYVGSQPGLQDAADGRDDFILLLTDGMPNCNDANTYSCTDVAQCRCTIDNGCAGGFCRKGCLDQDASAAQIAEQKKKGIRTILLAFGSNTDTGDAADTLEAMATAGGANLRTCPDGTDAECETGGCVAATKLCRRQYFRASNADELADALEAISSKLPPPDACTITLVDPPTSQQYVAVIVNGENIPAGPATWSFTGSAVKFDEGSTYCTSLKEQSSSTSIQIRYVQKL
jgi:hypothetical protein